MYGIIYKAIEQYVVNSFGDKRWETIKRDSNVSIDTATMEQPYNDDTNYKIAATTAKHTDRPLDEVLFNFGEHIIKTTSENYSIFMESRGDTMKDYLINLPNFHNRMMLIYPELTPPEFRVSNIEGNALVLHYVSTTKGMLSFIKGYLNGLMKIFKEMPEVSVINHENEMDKQYSFKISW